MAVGEAFLSAFLQVLFDRLASKHVVDFIRGHQIEKDLKRLKKTLSKVNSVIDDAENKQLKNKVVKEWLDELKDAVYDAEDVLDEFSTEAQRMKLDAESSQTSSNQFLYMISGSLDTSFQLFHSQMQSKVKAVRERFEELAQERFELGLEEVASGSSGSSTIRETSSVVDESCVHGRDDDKEKIIKLLLEVQPGCDSKFSVISIIGMGGVGKTTLAQILYNNEQIDRHFDVRAWACVSEEFDVKRITIAILESVTSRPSDFDDLNQVQIKVKEALTGKKFFIVLDDIWNMKYCDWDLLQKPFRVGAPGSRIIVTTHNATVSLKMKALANHYLKQLSEKDCLSVFEEHAFGGRNIDANTDLKAIGKKIGKKCRGLPLAAKTLGGLFRFEQDEDEWDDILHSKIWDLPEEENDILPALKLSYHHLPSHLKRCFSYCSIFPKHYEFEEREMVLLWMAEGFLHQPKGKMDLEDIGHKCFHELLSRSFFEPSSMNHLFVMHDLMSDLAQWVAGDTCFRLEGSLDNSEHCKISKRARHSSYIGGIHDGVKRLEAFHGVDCLRTFLPLKGVGVGRVRQRYLANIVTFDLLPTLSFLRVLSLSGYHITELPGTIGNFKHVRYLDFSHTRIRSLPESVTTLNNLQTMILNDCSDLKKLPSGLGNLINLRYLDITNVDLIEGMPQGMGRLTSLRKLSNFVVGKDSALGIGELMNLKHLQGFLRISKLENVTDARQAREAYLGNKKYLDVLRMEWFSEFNSLRNEMVEKEVLDMLRPHEKLKELNIKCYGGKIFPAWIGDPSFSNIVILTLENCEGCTGLPPLGKLPSLKDLGIKGMKEVDNVGLGFYGEGCTNPFPSLETLNFEDMPEWKDWFPCDIDTQLEVFSRLHELSIRECPKLVGSLPNHLPSLQKLVVHECHLLPVSVSNLPMLCRLDISKCQEVVQIGKVDLSSLRSMALGNISNVTSLTEGLIQGLSGVEDLEILSCVVLVNLWQKEVSLLQRLHLLCRLHLIGCENLENLQGLHNLTSLVELSIKGCPRLVSFEERVLPSKLRQLKIEDCSALKSVAEAISDPSCISSTLLEYLYIEGCDSLTSIAKATLFSTVKKLKIVSCPSLLSVLYEDEASSSSSSQPMRMQDSNNSSTSLIEFICIETCVSLASLSSSSTRGGELPATLKRLELRECPKLESIGETTHLQGNMSLESIQIVSCENLQSLPEGLNNLGEFRIIDCDNFVSFSDGGFPSTLRSLCIWGCSRLELIGKRLQNGVLDEVLLHATNLVELKICDCENLEALPYAIHNLKSLRELIIERCPGIISFPENGFPTNLISLGIVDLKIFKPLFRWGLDKLTSLRELVIEGGCPNLVSFPAKVLPTSLIRLSIGDFPNLKYLSLIGFQNLSSLESLKIRKCPKLQSFPDLGLLPSILQLYVHDCPLLKLQSKRYRGQEWPKIYHVPCIYIDNRGGGMISGHCTFPPDVVAMSQAFCLWCRRVAAFFSAMRFYIIFLKIVASGGSLSIVQTPKDGYYFVMFLVASGGLDIPKGWQARLAYSNFEPFTCTSSGAWYE